VRDDFSTAAQNTLVGALTIFSLANCQDEIEASVAGETIETTGTGENELPFVEEVESRSEELISDIIANITRSISRSWWPPMLRAMGYTAQTTEKAPDYGVDVIAHSDALGFEEPQVKVQVKHTTDSVGNQNLGRFLGTIN